MLESQPGWKDIVITFLDACEAVALRLVILIVFLFGAYGIIRHEIERNRTNGPSTPADDSKTNQRIAELERKIDVLIGYIGNTEPRRQPPKGDGMYD